MSVWVCRTGVSGQFANDFIVHSKIYLTRDKLPFDLQNTEKSVIIERLYENAPSAAKQTISNIWSQINIFANKMSIGDVVIIPQKASMLVSVAIISGDYVYTKGAAFPFEHSRNIRVLSTGIDTTDFPQSIKYSLGAFRTIFSIRQETEIKQLLTEKGVCFNEV